MTVAGSTPKGGTAGEPLQVPRLAEGVQLLGPYKDAGYAADHYLVGRGDGRIVLVSGVVYAIAEAIDGRTDLGAVARAVGERLGRHLEVAHLEKVIEQRLRPLGVVASEAPPGAASPEPAAGSPMLSVGLRCTLLPARAVGAVSGVLRPLFHPAVVAVALGLFVGVDAWFFSRPGLTAALVAVLGHPKALATTLGLLLVAMLTHELGHATACRYGGGRPGRIGIGVYLFFPAFFTNVTDAYRLSRAGRVRTDLGGVYFNAVFVVVAGLLLVQRRSAVLVAVVLLLQVGMCEQLLPLVRLDGYFVLSDLIGVPDLFGHVGLLLTRGRDARVRGRLRPRARALVLGWLAIVAPVLGALLALLALRLPLFVRVSWRVGHLEWAAILAAARIRDVAALVVDALSLVLVVLPFAGMALLALRGAGRLAARLGRVARGRRAPASTAPGTA